MRIWSLVALCAISLCLLFSTALGMSWQELLDRADSFAALGTFDAANTVADEAMANAWTEYDESDTTVKVWVYREGVLEKAYFRSYDEAETLYTRVLAIKERALGRNHDDVANAIHVIGWIYDTQGRYDEAEPLYKDAILIREDLHGEDHTEVARLLHFLGRIYGRQDRLAEAQSAYERALAIREKVLEPDHLDRAWTLNNLANLYTYQGKYVEAEAFHRRALAILEKGLGPDSPSVANSLLGIFDVFYQQGRYKDAEPFCKRALDINESALGPDHPDVGLGLSNLAALYSQQGKYEEAEPLHRRALAIWEKTLGPDHHDLTYGLHNLATFYIFQGKYAEAEPLLTRALAIKEKTLGPEHRDVAHTLSSLAALYARQGKYAEAEPILKRTLVVWENSLGPEHALVGVAVENLANFYRDQRRFAEAESLYMHTRALREKTLGSEATEVAYTLSDMAHLYSDQGRHAEAESLYVRALAIAEKTLGTEHTLVADVLKGLADVWLDQERYAEAEANYEQALAIDEQALGGEHPDVARILETMCGLYRLQDRDSQARELADRAYRIRQRNFTDNESGLSERDALTYSRYLRRSVSNYLSCYLDLGSAAEPTVEEASDIVLSSKGQISDRMFERQMNLIEETDSTALMLAESLRYTKFQLSLLFVEGPGEDFAGYRNMVDSLSNLANNLEAELSRHSASFTRMQDNRNVSTGRIADLLPNESALIEYVRFDYLELRPEARIPHYAAVVVTPDAEPVLKHLGEASDIDGLVDEYRAHMLRVSDANRKPTTVDRAEYEAIGRKLYERVWAPVEGIVSDRELVLVASDGALNMVSFGGLMDSDTTYLVERFPVHHLSSGRDVIRLKDDPAAGMGLFALGDPDYDALSEDTSMEIDAYVTRNVRSGCGELGDLEATPLPGTRSEVEEIILRWKESTGEPAIAYYGEEAGEERFKTDAPGKRAIHLATHGYFLEGRCQPDPAAHAFSSDASFTGENPLLLSGLLLAGANRKGTSADSLGVEDGILTAYEVTAMDLSGTEIVVLSACETGLGKVEEGEGVYGLRRAFQMAGARTVISALWPVPDIATADMIGHLYDRKDETIPETMRRLQLDKIKELRREGQSDHPFTWAGFMAMGDWR